VDWEKPFYHSFPGRKISHWGKLVLEKEWAPWDQLAKNYFPKIGIYFASLLAIWATFGKQG